MHIYISKFPVCAHVHNALLVKQVHHFPHPLGPSLWLLEQLALISTQNDNNDNDDNDNDDNDSDKCLFYFQVFFEIVYDERLDMTEGAYVLDVNINLDKEIPDLRFDVLINETIAIKHCSVIQEYLEYQYLEQPSSRSSRKCHIVRSPSTADQTDLLNQGRSGQFSVTYKPLARQMDEFQVISITLSEKKD